MLQSLILFITSIFYPEACIYGEIYVWPLYSNITVIPDTMLICSGVASCNRAISISFNIPGAEVLMISYHKLPDYSGLITKIPNDDFEYACRDLPAGIRGYDVNFYSVNGTTYKAIDVGMWRGNVEWERRVGRCSGEYFGPICTVLNNPLVTYVGMIR